MVIKFFDLIYVPETIESHTLLNKISYRKFSDKEKDLLFVPSSSGNWYSAVSKLFPDNFPNGELLSADHNLFHRNSGYLISNGEVFSSVCIPGNRANVYFPNVGNVLLKYTTPDVIFVETVSRYLDTIYKELVSGYDRSVCLNSSNLIDEAVGKMISYADEVCEKRCGRLLKLDMYRYRNELGYFDKWLDGDVEDMFIEALPVPNYEEVSLKRSKAIIDELKESSESDTATIDGKEVCKDMVRMVHEANRQVTTMINELNKFKSQAKKEAKKPPKAKTSPKDKYKDKK